MLYAEKIDRYLAGISLLESTVSGMTLEQLTARPVAGKWSALEVVCHIADFEPIYADRIKRIIAEESASLIPGDPDLFAASLSYESRDISEELALIRATRQQLTRILKSHPDSILQRTGNHLHDGPLTLEVLLNRVTNHIEHHIPFIMEKRRALGIA
ncbi:DinB family protein [Planctomicrobium sp. SH668]|uniref:DinB family protein n=1 Tax=Planctomicrobium sp. SH668 TaxID=3448126 RepID=UPI003F5C7A51